MFEERQKDHKIWGTLLLQYLIQTDSLLQMSEFYEFNSFCTA